MSLYNKEGQDFYYHKTSWLIITIILSIANHVLAITKELFLYNITKNEGVDAVKNNHYHQIILIIKMQSLLMFFASQENNTVIQSVSVIQFVLILGLLWILMNKIPFYNFTLLKMTLAFTAVYLSFSFLSLLQVFSTNTKILGSVDFLVLILPVFVIKIALLGIITRFQRILRGEFVSPEHALHYGILLEHFLLTKSNNKIDNEFIPNDFIMNGILTIEEDDFEKRVYKSIVSRLEYVLALNPKSELLLIYMLEIYMTKLLNIPKFLELFKRFEGMKLSRYNRGKIEQFYQKIDEIYDGEETRLELANHFKFSKFTKIIKKKIIVELQKHIEFWTDLEKQVLDVKQTVNRAIEVDAIHLALQRQFGRNYEDFRYNSPQVLLMYAIYLHNVRFLHSEGTQLLRKFELLFANQLIENKAEVSVTPAVVAILSLDKKKPGQIVDISGPLNDVFHAKKNNLIGMNFGCLFPTAIAKIYQEQIYEYSKSPSYKLDHKYKTYGKTADGEMFEMEAYFQLYCYGNKEITVALLMKKKSEGQVLVIAGTDGAIVDSSKGFKDTLFNQGLKISPPSVLQGLSYQFEEINGAFNSVYCNKENIQQVSCGISAADTNCERQDFVRSSNRKFSDTLNPHNNSNILLLGGTSVMTSRGLELDSSRPLHDVSMSISTREPDHKLHHNEISKERAMEICEDFLKGKETVLNPRKGSALFRREVLKARVQIKPYIMGHEIYKVVVLTNIKRNGSMLIANSDEDIDSPDHINQENYSNETFGDDFPEAEEKIVVRQITLGKELNFFFEKTHPEPEKKKNFIEHKLSGEEPQEGDNNRTRITILQGVGMSEHNSYKENLHRDTRIMRTLQEISVSNKLHPALKSSIIVVFLVIISILLLAGINYVIAKGSINEINKGINIVSTGARKLSSVINTWQDAIYLYLEALNPGFLDSENLAYFLYDIGNTVNNLAVINSGLRDALMFLEDKDFVKKTFEKDIEMWNSDGGKTQLDVFTATDLLINEYKMLASFENITELAERDYIPYTLNNTANDFLQKSYEITRQTEEYLQSRIDSNIRTIKNILAFENTVLFLFCLAVILVAIVIRNGFQRLFRVLVRIQHEGVTEHLGQLKKVRAFLDEDIDTKYFTKIALEIFHGASLKTRAKRSKRVRSNSNSSRHSRYIMRYMTIYLLRIVLTACLLAPVIAGLFGVSLASSISYFEDFQDIKEQVALLSDMNYQSYLFLNIYNFQVIFNSNPKFTVLNNVPLDVIDDYLDQFSALNRKLSEIYLQQANKNIDAVSVTVVKNDACVFLSGHTLSVCQTHAANTGIKGLFSVGIEFLEVSKSYIQQYLRNQTPENALEVSSDFTVSIGDIATTLQNGYPALRAHVLEILEEKVKKANDEQREFLGVISGIILVYAGFLYLLPLRRFRELDLARRRVLKMIPHQIIQENRMFSYYLVRDFGNEVDRIKNIL